MKLHYRIIGEGNPVLLLHGLFGMSDNLQSFGRQLAEKNNKVIIVDLRNHGQWETVARELGVHRNSVRHRIGIAVRTNRIYLVFHKCNKG